MATPSYISNTVDTTDPRVRRDSLDIFQTFRRRANGKVYAHVGKATVPPSNSIRWYSLVVDGQIERGSEGFAGSNDGSNMVYPVGQLNAEHRIG